MQMLCDGYVSKQQNHEPGGVEMSVSIVLSYSSTRIFISSWRGPVSPSPVITNGESE
jgi:hypothetical protein